MHSESRNGTRVRVLAIHTTEGMMRAKDLRDWTSWPGSSHASADETGVLMTPADGFVDYSLAAWTLRSGNHWSENIELCAWARYTRAEWLARPKLLEACAQWLADRSKARGIPLVKLTPAQYRAGQSGVIGHVDHTVGYADGTHTDPGPNFPYDVVLPRAQVIANGTTTTAPEEDDMFETSDRQAVAECRRMLAVLLGAQSAANPAEAVTLQRIADIADNSAEARRMLAVVLGAAKPAAGEQLASGSSDPEVLAAAIKTALGDDLASAVAARLTVTVA